METNYEKQTATAYYCFEGGIREVEYSPQPQRQPEKDSKLAKAVDEE